MKRILFAAASASAALAAWNGICSIKERKKLPHAYGQTITVHGRKMVADVQGEPNSPTVILLPGAMTASPVLGFYPLAETLSKFSRVITLEPFGYGLSDEAETPRTLDHVVEELHACVTELGCNRYYLMAHSLSGLYCLHWANRYPEEVLGFIGLDVSVPGQNEAYPGILSISAVNKLLAAVNKTKQVLGISRLCSLRDTKKALRADPAYAYTAEQLQTYRSVVLNRAFNKTVFDELTHVDAQLEAVKHMTFPPHIPVLQFVSAANCKTIPTWEQLHRDVITEEVRSRVIVMDGSHFLHLEKKNEITETTIRWLTEEAASDEL